MACAKSNFYEYNKKKWSLLFKHYQVLYFGYLHDKMMQQGNEIKLIIRCKKS